MDSRDPVVVFFEKSVIQSITLLRKWDLWRHKLIMRLLVFFESSCKDSVRVSAWTIWHLANISVNSNST